MLFQRVAVAAVGIPVIAGLTWLGGPVFAIAAGIVLTFAALGFYADTDPPPAFLRDASNGRDWLLLALFATFATDTCAYFVGRAIGRTKIAPAISPGKTLEGSLGGFAGGGAAFLLLNEGLDAGAGAEIIGLALLLPLAGEMGDLAESLIKRGAGIKDASHVIPGHGGFLDRLDSLLITVPLVYYYLTWIIL